MKIRKSSMLFLVGAALISISISVTAESDSSGDVYYFNGVDAEVIWEFYGDKEHIDVTDASYGISGSDIIVSLTVSDSISNHKKIQYYIILKTDITSYYAIDYSNESGMATGNGNLAGYVDTDPEFILSTDGKTISYTFSDVDTSLDYTLKAYAVEYLSYGITYGEAWYDYAPNAMAPWHTSGAGGSDGESRGTPGFETITLIAAIGIALIALRKRK